MRVERRFEGDNMIKPLKLSWAKLIRNNKVVVVFVEYFFLPDLPSP